MTTDNYHFIREVKTFDLDSYIAHLGWIAPGVTTVKIYSSFDSLLFYLHDEIEDRLFEFSADFPLKLKSSEEYEKVLKAYFTLYQQED